MTKRWGVPYAFGAAMLLVAGYTEKFTWPDGGSLLALCYNQWKLVFARCIR
ncbi:MAG: hypothetical protein M3436_04620 [Pseudomonadota bacterium]|nr:hypothetical protein [Pseudomonadota bacterium]